MTYIVAKYPCLLPVMLSQYSFLLRAFRMSPSLAIPVTKLTAAFYPPPAPISLIRAYHDGRERTRSVAAASSGG